MKGAAKAGAHTLTREELSQAARSVRRKSGVIRKRPSHKRH